MLRLVRCLYYLHQRCTVKQISDNEIYLLIKYIKSVLWRVVKCLSYIEEARCLKVKEGEKSLNSFTCLCLFWFEGLRLEICWNLARRILCCWNFHFVSFNTFLNSRVERTFYSDRLRRVKNDSWWLRNQVYGVRKSKSTSKTSRLVSEKSRSTIEIFFEFIL